MKPITFLIPALAALPLYPEVVDAIRKRLVPYYQNTAAIVPTCNPSYNGTVAFTPSSGVTLDGQYGPFYIYKPSNPQPGGVPGD